MSKKLLIVDDHLLFAESLIYLLETFDATIEPVALQSIGQALAWLAEGEGADLLLLDYAMPDQTGLQGLLGIREAHPDLPVAFLSGHEDPVLVAEALQLGAIGWLPKSMGGRAMVSALQLLLAGERFVPAALMPKADGSVLTPREKQVAVLVGRGMTDKQIAGELGLETGTVKVHVKNLLRKTGAQNRTQFALRYRF